jgi:hypothetical protein
LNSNVGFKRVMEAVMQIPVVLAARGGLHALTRKFVAEVLVSSLATLLVMVLFSHLTKPAAPLAPDERQLASQDAQPAVRETRESLDDFMERVALSHVALKAPPAAASETASVTTNDTAPATAAPSASRQAAARHDRPHSAKAHVASVTAPPPAQAPQQPVEQAVASNPAGADWLRPLQTGMRLVASLQDMVAASSARVVNGVASVGGALTSFGRKPQS